MVRVRHEQRLMRRPAPGQGSIQGLGAGHNEGRGQAGRCSRAREAFESGDRVDRGVALRHLAGGVPPV